MSSEDNGGAFRFFLNHALYTPDQHPNRYDKFVYDDEFIHYGLLSILLQASPTFVSGVLSPGSKVELKRVLPPLRRHRFDLEVQTSSGDYYFEIKTWSLLGSDQFAKQTEFLRQTGAHGIYLLAPRQTRLWPAERIERESGHRSRLLRFSELAAALADSRSSFSPPITELADVYHDSVLLLGKRAV